MSRLEPLEPADLSIEQLGLLEAIQSGPRGAAHGPVGLVGPFGVWVRSPLVGHAAQAFGATLRFETSLPANVREIAICTVGAYYQAKFEFAAHAPMAIAAGVSDVAVEAIRRGELPNFQDAREALAYEVAATLLSSHHLDDALYDRARAAFRESELIELVTIVGYYCQISLTLNAFDVPLRDGMEDPFPDAP